MPIYEYLCSSCKNKFELLTLSSANVDIECANCHSTEVRKLFSVFAKQTSGDSVDFSGEMGCGDESCASGACGCANFGMDD